MNLSDDEKLVFSFACYGETSFKEIKKLCDLYGLPFDRAYSALCDLCNKGVVSIAYFRINPHYCHIYCPIFFRVTNLGKEIFRNNYRIFFDLLMRPQLFSTDCKEAVQAFLANFIEDQPEE